MNHPIKIFCLRHCISLYSLVENNKTFEISKENLHLQNSRKYIFNDKIELEQSRLLLNLVIKVDDKPVSRFVERHDISRY